MVSVGEGKGQLKVIEGSPDSRRLPFTVQVLLHVRQACEVALARCPAEATFYQVVRFLLVTPAATRTSQLTPAGSGSPRMDRGLATR